MREEFVEEIGLNTMIRMVEMVFSHIIITLHIGNVIVGIVILQRKRSLYA